MITLTTKGDLSKTDKFLDKLLKRDIYSKLEVYAQRGVEALAAATPKRSGLTAASWIYEIDRSPNAINITWKNTNVNKSANIAILIQYGHGTRNGGYVRGIDYINPALKPVFDEIAESVWKEVTTQ